MLKLPRFRIAMLVLLVLAISIIRFAVTRDLTGGLSSPDTLNNFTDGEQLNGGITAADIVEADNDFMVEEIGNEELLTTNIMEDVDDKTVEKSGDTENEEDSIKGATTQKLLVCIDPGHQQKANYDMEPIAPSSTVMKEKMSWGTMGVSTEIPEYKLNLEVSLKLKKVLKESGFEVIMTRETNDVNSGNVERTKIANESNADLVIRIHADGLDNSSVKGMSVLYPGDKYIKDEYLLTQSKNAALKVLDSMISHTGAKSRGIVKRDDLTGFNWSTVPVILIEMGFMTNPDEDRLLNSAQYQDKIVRGIVEGIENYFVSAGLK